MARVGSVESGRPGDCPTGVLSLRNPQLGWSEVYPGDAGNTGNPAQRRVVVHQTLHLGMPTVVESSAEATPFAALFEDDGKIGRASCRERVLTDV